ncbi:MAG: hypothetical protein KTR26_06880 [Flammeovirgaceae bacterium]|nr:hypothetical protein [Flammeovirgaceae bacterium]
MKSRFSGMLPWEDIYKQDTERPQDFNLATDLGITIPQVYADYGYKVIETPKYSPNQPACRFYFGKLGLDYF